MSYPWLQQSWQQVSRQYQQGYLPHALILSGVQGLGKHLLGKKLAQLVLCDAKLDEPCGTCRQCHLFATDSHPDYFCIEPEESSKIIKIEQVRDLIDKLNQTPLVAKSQVVLINPLEGLTLKAANALLKTLEEPTGRVFFILIAHRLTQIPVTILSRCQLLPIHANNTHQTMQWLMTELSCTEQQADVLLRLAHGAPLEAVALANRNVLDCRNKVLAIMGYEHTGLNPLPDIESVLKDHSDDVFVILASILQDLRKCHLGVDRDKWTNSDAVKHIQPLASEITVDQLQAQFTALESINKALTAGIHINPQMALERIIFERVA